MVESLWHVIEMAVSVGAAAASAVWYLNKRLNKMDDRHAADMQDIHDALIDLRHEVVSHSHQKQHRVASKKG